MKKSVALILSIMLLVTMLVITGCTKQTNVEFTVEGIDAYAVKFADSTQNTRRGIQRQEDPNDINAPAKYTLNAWADGDYSLLLIDANGNTYPVTLKLHNGKVEADAPEGITIHPTIK